MKKYIILILILLLATEAFGGIKDAIVARNRVAPAPPESCNGTCYEDFSGAATPLTTKNDAWIRVGTPSGVISTDGSGLGRLANGYEYDVLYNSDSTQDVSQFVIKANPAESARVRPCIRMGTDQEGYCLDFVRTTGAWSCSIFETKSFIDYCEGTYDQTVDHTLKITASGSTITVYVDGDQVGTTSDDTLSSGHPGIRFGNGTANTTRIDDWQDY